jgi:hypothetical protein
VIESVAYRHLSPIARAILVELVSRMDGSNNGAIHVSYVELADCLNRKNQAVLGPAIGELMQHGLVDLSAESVWQERKAREYRLTFVNTTDAIGRPIKATNDYVRWTPTFGKSDATNVVAGKPKTATAFVAGKIAAATAVVAKTHEKPPICSDLAATDGVVPILMPSMDPFAGQAHPPSSTPSTNGELIAELSCERCSEPFAPAGRDKPKRFCSEHFQKAEEYRRFNERKRTAA